MKKIVLIRKKYEDEFKNLEKIGSEIFEYLWTEDVKSFDDLKDLKNRTIWYRGPIEDMTWRKWMREIAKSNNVLNHPDDCAPVASKVNFYQALNGLDYMPKCWFRPSDAEYPCVEKPDNAHSGEGVRVVEKEEDADTERGDLWMEKIDFDTEWRVWCFNNTIIGTYWRKHNKGIEDKSTEDAVDFDYIPKVLPNEKEAKEIINDLWEKFPLNFHAVDLFYKDGKWWVCEMNGQPGYKEQVWKDTIKILKHTYLKK